MIGFKLALQNAGELTEASETLAASSPHVALAICQIAQEEIGKSFILLCSPAFKGDEDWKRFWKYWCNHEEKARLARSYKTIFQSGLSFTRPSDGRAIDGTSFRSRISKEKEVGLYVDYDHTTGKFILPRHAVLKDEHLNRHAAVSSLGLAADAIQEVITRAPAEERFSAYGHYAVQLWRADLSKEDMMRSFVLFETFSPLHARIGAELRTEFVEAERVLFGPLESEPKPR